MTQFVQQGSAIFPQADANLISTPKLPPGTYTVCIHPDRGFYLDKIADVSVPSKRYGNTDTLTARILTTFDEREAQTTGVLLSGDKGSGKSMLASNLSIELLKIGVPTILVNAPFHGEGFNKFLALIDQPVMMLFDEFEKTYSEEEHQEAVLTLLAGTHSAHQKLYVFTCNDKHSINRHMLNRPGRIFYHITYRGVEPSAIREYAEENLVNKDHIQDLLVIAATVSSFNFDMLKSLVEEMNRYREPAREAIALMNIRPENNDYTHYDGEVFVDDVRADNERVRTNTSNPLVNGVVVSFRRGEAKKNGEYVWENQRFDRSKLRAFDNDTGKLTFVDGNVRVELTRQQTREFSYY